MSNIKPHKDPEIIDADTTFCFNDKARHADRVEVMELFDEVYITPITKQGKPSKAVYIHINKNSIRNLIDELEKYV